MGRGAIPRLRGDLFGPSHQRADPSQSTGLAKPPPRPGRGILTRTNPEGLKALRLLALERDTTLQDLAVEALNDVLAKYGGRRVVKNPAGGGYAGRALRLSRGQC